MRNLKDLFLLDPEIVFLNHGSFGACPRPVFESYQAWQLELERRPVEFLARRALQLLADARQSLANFLRVSANDIVYFPNPTTAVNMVGRSLINRAIAPLGNGDEILTTDHEYGAMDRTWDYICHLSGAKYIHQTIPLPVSNYKEFVELFWRGVTKHTRVIFISHITSPTALILPVKEICRRSRQSGIISIVDGAHAPGQIDLDLNEIGADIYVGACHKWLMAPKGSSFLYAHPSVQPWLDPLVISWGYKSEYPSPSQFIDYHEWQGTRDISPFLAVPAAIEFQQQYRWAQVRKNCHALANKTRIRLINELDFEPISPTETNSQQAFEPWYMQMFTVKFPFPVHHKMIQEHLYQYYRIEIPVIKWNEQYLLRVSIQGYNDQHDIESLINALQEIFSSKQFIQ